MNQADFRVSAEAQAEVHSSLGICSVKFDWLSYFFNDRGI